MTNSSNFISDTIAAISTAPGEGGIAIIRVSGPQSLPLADKIFKCSPPLPSSRNHPALIYGHVVSGTEILDEALLLSMRAPRSYTREDVVEFHCHGGTISAKRILRAIIEKNVRLADPGEFTKRAFLNGRLDLLQAEAVLDLIRTRTDRGAAMAVEQMEGALSNSFAEVYTMLLAAASDMEASLDFIENELPDSFMPDLSRRLDEAAGKIEALLASWDEGHLLRDGALVVISGRPNAGKSTLLNALLGKDRVIVSPVPGTTRDIIEEQVVIEGIPIRLVDTAGLRSSECGLEQEGVRRAQKQIEKADINLYVIDASQKPVPEDFGLVSGLDPKTTILVFNKTDLGRKIPHDDFGPYDYINAQVINGQGLTDIRNRMIEKLGIAKNIPHHFAIAERHRQILMDSRSDLSEAIVMIKTNDESNIVLAVAKVKSALEHIARATGKTYHDDLLDSIFTRFCIGK